MAKKPRKRPARQPRIRINERIRAHEIRVVYQDLNLVLPTSKALAKAKELGLDLVEIAPNAHPPVCKIVDYGKYMYDLSKQQKEQTKPKTKVKEVKFRVRTEEHDYNIKLCHAEDFLEHGDKLRIQLQFRGRENAHRELGFVLMDRIKNDLATMAKVDAEPKLAGRQIVMMMSPLPKAQQKRHFHIHKGGEIQEEDDYEDDEALEMGFDDEQDLDEDGEIAEASSDSSSEDSEDDGGDFAFDAEVDDGRPKGKRR